MNNYHSLDITFEYRGQQQVITPVLLRDDQEVVLVDCGYPGFIPLLESAIHCYGLTFQDITRLIITHHDIDHLGSLAAIKRIYPHICIIAHEVEAPYIEGQLKAKRLLQAEDTLHFLPAEDKQQAESFIAMLQAIEPTPVDVTVTNGEHLSWSGGIEIIHTSGHTPGHLSLYLLESKTLISGDALVIEQGRLDLANPQYTLNLQEAVRSIERLLDYEIEQVICYHGGLYSGNVRQALQAIIREYKG